MKRSMSLKNSGFAKSQTIMDRDHRIAARSARMAIMARPTLKQVAAAVYGPAKLTAKPKDAPPVRSEAYRRAVASLPCINCGVAGFSQAAHPPATARSRKEDDRLCVPLCCTRPGMLGCHAAFDRGELIPGNARRGQMIEWAQKTQTQIKRLGLWPNGLPEWSAK